MLQHVREPFRFGGRDRKNPMKTANPRAITVAMVRERGDRVRRTTLMLAGLIALTLAVLFAATSAKASPETEAFIQMTVDDGYEILNDTALSDDERFNRFQDFMLSLTDTRRIARFTLGPYVNRATEAEVNQFVDAFTNYAVTVYEDRLRRW